jgi:hypothetical protein
LFQRGLHVDCVPKYDHIDDQSECTLKGQLQRKKKQIEIRGLNKNCNHHLKNLFKAAAVTASTKPGPFQEFYAA